MPTGYTADVQTGKITSLSDFALTCARAFDFLITMRDDPLNAPIPERFEPQLKYYNTKKTEAQKILAELPGLSLDECHRHAIIEHADALDKKYETDKDQSLQNYNSMLAKVENWQVPKELTKLRDFMLEQLRNSKDIDCFSGHKWPEPTLKSPEEWRNAALAEAARDLSYALDHIRDETRRTNERNAWLKLLRDSLKEEV